MLYEKYRTFSYSTADPALDLKAEVQQHRDFSRKVSSCAVTGSSTQPKNPELDQSVHSSETNQVHISVTYQNGADV